MANKKSIDQINAELDTLHRKLSRTVKRIDELRELRRKIRMGKIKQPPPKGVKVKIGSTISPELHAELNDPLDDIGRKVRPVGFGSGGSGAGAGAG